MATIQFSHISKSFSAGTDAVKTLTSMFQTENFWSLSVPPAAASLPFCAW